MSKSNRMTWDDHIIIYNPYTTPCVAGLPGYGWPLDSSAAWGYASDAACWLFRSFRATAVDRHLGLFSGTSPSWPSCSFCRIVGSHRDPDRKAAWRTDANTFSQLVNACECNLYQDWIAFHTIINLQKHIQFSHVLHIFFCVFSVWSAYPLVI